MYVFVCKNEIKHDLDYAQFVIEFLIEPASVYLSSFRVSGSSSVSNFPNHDRDRRTIESLTRSGVH